MELSLTDFVLFSLLGSCALVVVFALISRASRTYSETQALSRRVICRLCLYAFEDESHDKTVDCPHCGAANEKGRNRRLG